MWPFGRWGKAGKPKPGISETDAPGSVTSGPQLVRRVEITVEREWTSTVVRKRNGDEGATENGVGGKADAS